MEIIDVIPEIYIKQRNVLRVENAVFLRVTFGGTLSGHWSLKFSIC
jgi:hypothetical protein